MKKIWALLLITAVFIVSGCGSAGSGKTTDGKITVAASFYPMAEFARAVGGSHAEVYTMIGDGIEPHDWEPLAEPAQSGNRGSGCARCFYKGRPGQCR